MKDSVLKKQKISHRYIGYPIPSLCILQNGLPILPLESKGHSPKEYKS